MGGLINLTDYPNYCATVSVNSCTKSMVDKRVWQIKRYRINENSVYIYVYTHLVAYLDLCVSPSQSLWTVWWD